MIHELSARAASASLLEFRGYLVDGSGSETMMLWDGEGADHLAPRLDSVSSLEALGDLLLGINGGFAFFHASCSRVLAATDRAGVFPLYFLNRGDRLILGSDALEVGARGGRGIDVRAALALMAMEFVPGRRTLAEGVEQLKPGEAVEFIAEGGGWRMRRLAWWRLGFRLEGKIDLTEKGAELAGCMTAVVEDWGAALAARHREGKVAIPLSGGLDSRFLACLFSRVLPGRTVAVSYGDPASEDVVLAGRAAGLLGMEFRQVPFRDGSFLGAPARRSLAESIGATCRLTLADGGFSLARRFGIGEGGKPDGARDVASFLPGHLGGVISGGKFRADIPASAGVEELAAMVRLYIASFTGGALESLVAPRFSPLAESAGELLRESIADTAGGLPAVRLRQWYFRELVHRRVMPEMAVYRRSSLPAVPLADNRILDFFAGLPAGGLRGQAVYRLAAVNHLFPPAGDAFLRLPLQDRGPLTARQGGRGIVRRVENRLLRHLAPERFERRYTSCPMMTLWRRDEQLRREVWEEIENAVILPAFLDHGRLMEYLRRRLGRDYHLTTLGVWNLLTVELAGRRLEGR